MKGMWCGLARLICWSSCRLVRRRRCVRCRLRGGHCRLWTGRGPGKRRATEIMAMVTVKKRMRRGRLREILCLGLLELLRGLIVEGVGTDTQGLRPAPVRVQDHLLTSQTRIQTQTTSHPCHGFNTRQTHHPYQLSPTAPSQTRSHPPPPPPPQST